MKKAGTLGWPMPYTKSPLIHNHWLAKYGMETQGVFNALPTPPERLEESIKKYIADGYIGFSVTLPHKQTIMGMMSKLEDSAQKIGAVNSVSVNQNGIMTGRNTDGFGFIENLKESAPDFKFEGSALVLGAGGATRAIIYALLQEGMRDIFVVNRTVSRAEDLANAFGVRAYGWDAIPRLMENTALIVNTTSLGMVGQPQLDMDVSLAPSTALVCDIVYTPLHTGLLQVAHASGLRTVTGIGMLLHQARPSFAAWFGVMPDIDDELRAKVLA